MSRVFSVPARWALLIGILAVSAVGGYFVARATGRPMKRELFLVPAALAVLSRWLWSRQQKTPGDG